MKDQLARLSVTGVTGSFLALACSAVVGCSSLSGDAGGSGNSVATSAGAGNTTGGVSNGTAGANSAGNPGNPGGGASNADGGAGTSNGGAQSGGGANGGANNLGGAPSGGAQSGGGASGMGSGGVHGGAAGMSNAGGTAGAVGDPSTHTQADVCTQWKAGHVITEPNPLTASGAECDPGTLKPGAITDTLVRLNMFRWLEGLGPVTDDPQYDSDAQACANLEAWWDFTSALSPHMPPATAKCYTTSGGSTAGQSNISWGAGGPSQTIDQYMEDDGNATTLGHRRWVVNPPLNPIGIGYWAKGGTYGDGSCLRIFASKGTGPSPNWNAVPPAGFAPIQMAQYKQWSFEGKLAGIAKATATVLRVEDNTPLPVTAMPLSQGYGQDTMSFDPMGWTVEAGKTYRVTISGLTGANVVYDVKPVMCN